jgi:hypothetical protein
MTIAIERRDVNVVTMIVSGNDREFSPLITLIEITYQEFENNVRKRLHRVPSDLWS